MKTYCGNDGREMKTEACGITLVQVFFNGDPYKLYKADLLRCPLCGAAVVTRLGAEPFAEHYQPGFENVLERERIHSSIFFESGSTGPVHTNQLPHKP